MAKPAPGCPQGATARSAGLFEIYCFLTSVSSPDAELTLTENGLDGITEKPSAEAQVRLTVDSDDLLALCQGELPFATAWARGRVRIDASVLDLLRLRTLI